MNLFDLSSGMPFREPSAVNREAAAGLHDIFTAYVEAGFTSEQAMQLVCALLEASVAAYRQRGDGA